MPLPARQTSDLAPAVPCLGRWASLRFALDPDRFLVEGWALAYGSRTGPLLTIRPLVERNTPADPDARAEALAQARPGETVAQAQGRAGGETKDANAQADNAP